MKTLIFISFVNRPRNRLPGSHVNFFITLIKPGNCFPQMAATFPFPPVADKRPAFSTSLPTLARFGGSVVAFLVVSVQRLSSRGFPWQLLTD